MNVALSVPYFSLSLTNEHCTKDKFFLLLLIMTTASPSLKLLLIKIIHSFELATKLNLNSS